MAIEKPFSVNDRIIHAEHGSGVVTFVGEDYLGLNFSDLGNVLFRYDAAKIMPWSEAAETAWQAEILQNMPVADDAKPEWPDSTFELEQPETPHYMGSHWSPFVDDVAETIKQLPNIIGSAQMMEGIGLHRKPFRSLPETWLVGFHLVWPMQRHGMILTCRISQAEKQNELASFFPFWSEGSEHRLIIDFVSVWDGQVEAQITTSLGEAQITFFDAHFLINRLWYETGCECQFILTGIAYRAIPSVVMEMPFKPNADQVAWENSLREALGKEPDWELPSVVNLGGMAALLPISGWDQDEYSFRGPVKRVRPFENFLGQSGWLVRVTVMRLADYVTEDVDLDIVITQRVWKHESPPTEGMDLEGELWLQGYLWLPPATGNRAG